MGFSVELNSTELIQDSIVDLIFLLDIIVIFCTAVIKEGSLVTDRRSIAKDYLSSWFIIDFLSTVRTPFEPSMSFYRFSPLHHHLIITSAQAPIDAIVNLFQTDSSPAFYKSIAFLRLFRMLKLTRVLKLKRLYLIVEEKTGINPAALSMGSLLVRILFTSHVIACIWYYTGDQLHQTYGESWVNLANIEGKSNGS